MFALVAFFRIQIGITKRLINSHGIYIPSSASNIYYLLWDIFSPTIGTGNNKHLLH